MGHTESCSSISKLVKCCLGNEKNACNKPDRTILDDRKFLLVNMTTI